MRLAVYKSFITHEIFCIFTWRLRDILVMPVLSAEISVAIKDTSGDSLVTASLVEMMSLLTSVTFLESSLIWPSTFSTDFIWLFMVKMEFVRPDIPKQKKMDVSIKCFWTPCKVFTSVNLLFLITQFYKYFIISRSIFQILTWNLNSSFYIQFTYMTLKRVSLFRLNLSCYIYTSYLSFSFHN